MEINRCRRGEGEGGTLPAVRDKWLKHECAVNFINLPHLHKKKPSTKSGLSKEPVSPLGEQSQRNQLYALQCSSSEGSSYYFQRARNVEEHLTVDGGGGHVQGRLDKTPPV